MSGAWLSACSARDDVEIAGLVVTHEPTARRRAVEFQLANPVLGTNLKQVLKEVEPDVVFDVTVPEATPGWPVERCATVAACSVKSRADSMNKAIDARYAARMP